MESDTAKAVSRILRKEQIMRLVVVTAVTLLALAIAGTAVAAAGWTPAQAAAKVKTTYTTADTLRLADAQANLKRDLAAGIPETDPRIIRDRQYVADAKVGAKPDRVTCAGVGKKAKRYAKFHCTAHVVGTGEYATDGFSKSVRLTVRVPFRVLAGWR